jgi:membrane protease YdiL (CAAX protease family)
MEEKLSPSPHFPLMAAIFEGSLVVVAIALGWLLDSAPLTTLSADARGLLVGVVAVVPPLVLLVLCLKLPVAPFSHVLRVVDELLVPLFKNCGWIEMAGIATLAGIGEEMLFRGVLQATAANWTGRLLGAQDWPWGTAAAAWMAAVAVAVLFGLMHAVNTSYAILAGLIGLYLGGAWIITGNLMVPITAHALYDFVALAYLVKIRKPKQGE